jgi:alpha-galactosidase
MGNSGLIVFPNPLFHFNELLMQLTVETCLRCILVSTITGVAFCAGAGIAVTLEKAAASPEEAVILTPKPPPPPRINGAKIFGVRLGHPFLFTIPATGQRPMEFAVEGLPEGLTVDSQTGRISGSLKARGEYAVTFHVQNALGQAERKFKIVCGDTLALTPMMGWSTWYFWSKHLSDRIVRDGADAMLSSGLINHGWSYLEIAEFWPIKPGSKAPMLSGESRDSQGNINTCKWFPDMKRLADYIHGKGLKAGIYTSPGPLTCEGYVGAYQHEQQDAQQFAAWGFDYLMYDWCSYEGVAKIHELAALKKPYHQMGDILKKLDRDIVLKICQYGWGDVWKWGREAGGNCWRTGGDLGAPYRGIPTNLSHVFDLYGRNELQKYAGPGGWNDPDNLLLGILYKAGEDVSGDKPKPGLPPNSESGPTSLSPNEQYAHMSLWCLLAAPLFFGGDVRQLDAFTLSLLTNDEVIEVDQDPLGKSALRVSKNGDHEVWAKDLEDGSKAVGLFNRGAGTQNVTAKWSDLGLTGKQTVRDLWRQKDLGGFDDQFSAPVGRHGVVLLRLRAGE